MLRVLGGMEGARARRRAGPEAMPKPWKSRDEKKVVHPPLVTVSFLWALVEAGAGVAARNPVQPEQISRCAQLCLAPSCRRRGFEGVKPLMQSPAETSSLGHAHGRDGQPGCHHRRVEVTRSRDEGWHG